MSDARVSKKETVVLIDGFGLIFRAYYAVPTTMATSDGEQTNAVYGFASMLLDVIRKRNPEYAVIALDTGRTFRHDLYADYKGTRAAMPEDLSSQLERVNELIDALNIPVQKQERYEADDVIGTLSRELADQGYQVVVITGDSDLLQLVGDNILVVLPGARRFGELREYDTAAVIERYGFGPEYVADYKALVGDTSDNIPGVPGIGDKTAKKLIGEFGGLEEIIAHADDVTPTRARTSLKEHIDDARASKRLATIVRDMELDLDLSQARVRDYDRDKIVALFRTLEFRSLLDKLPEPEQRQAPLFATQIRPPAVQTVVRSRLQLEALTEAMRAVGEFAVDVETTDTDPMRAGLVGIAIATAATASWYVPIGHQAGEQLSADEVRAVLDPVYADPALRCYTHHGKYDLQVLERHGYRHRPISFDTMIAAYLLGEQSIRLKDLSFNRLGIQQTEITELIGTGKSQITMDRVEIDTAAPYACADVECTFMLVGPLREDCVARNQLVLLETLELPVTAVLLRMERAGIALDNEILMTFGQELGERITELEAEIIREAGQEISVRSNKQVGELLFETLGLPTGRRTKTGYSVDSDVLESIRDEHAVVPLILEHRAVSKLKSTYADTLGDFVNPETGRVHTTFNQTVAATGRLASTNPNLQNIPVRTEQGRRIRRAFVADHRPAHRIVENAVFLAADYSQMELRIMAHMSADPYLVDAFTNGADIHAATAALVNDVPLSEVTKDQRRIAKTVNFGILYGMQAFGLARDTGMSRADAQDFIDTYWARLPKVKQFYDQLVEGGKEKGYVETLLGRRRYLPDLNSSNGMRRLAATRMAMNMPIQGTQADIIKQAMIDLDAVIMARGLPARILLQVHDELVLEVDETQLVEVAAVVKSTMEGACTLDVPVIADVRSGPNWEDMTPFTLP